MAEIVILFAGVVARYAFDHPLVWVEELAAILFLWLVSLGAVIALRRGEHMRMTVIVGRLGPRVQRLAACFSAMLVVVVTLGLIVPGLSYADQQAAILTPVMQLPGSVEIYGQLAALALLLYVALRQLAGRGELAGARGGAGVGVAAVSPRLWALQDTFDAIGNGSLIVFFIGIVGVCIFLGVPDRLQLRHRDVRLHVSSPARSRSRSSSARWTRACPRSSCWPCRCSSCSGCCWR